MVKFVGSVVLSLLPIYANVLSAQAQSCIPPNTLCANLPVVGHVIGDCSSQDITLPSMPACCHVRSMANKPICPSTNPTTTQNCRSIELDGPACVAAGQCRGMYLSMNITSNPSRERCCDICTCYGDPHCESFTGVIDTWVLCDARTPQGTSDKCPITEKQCLKEKDHNGNQCVWLNPPSGTKWQLGLMGSQCVFNSGIGPLPEMLMYKADDFEMRLVLGERGIITQAKMKTNGAFFSMTSQACFDDYFNLSRDPRAIPWRNDKGVADPSPSWLPRTWQYKLLPGGDIMWYVFGLKSNIGLRIRCTRTAVRVNGVTRFGPPRLNIEEIIEPKKVADRTGADGFCKTNKIDKLKSTTKNSEIIMSKNCAEGVQDDAQIESLLCSKTALAAGSAACRAEWCKATRKDWQDCVVEINKLGWARTWCASKTLPSMDPDLCVNGECAQCVSNVGDFGWPYTIEYWSNRGGTGVDEECFTVDTLPTDAIACQKAITIQYQESPGVWKSFKAIPEGAKLCGGSLVFNSNQHDVLFRYKIRVQQCDLRPDCLSDSCSSQSGFTASFSFKTEDDLQEDLVDLVESGDLVCNPELYGTDTKGCLQNTPEMCPCPSPTPT